MPYRPCNVCGFGNVPTFEAGGEWWCDNCARWQTEHSAGLDHDPIDDDLPRCGRCLLVRPLATWGKYRNIYCDPCAGQMAMERINQPDKEAHAVSNSRRTRKASSRRG